MVIDSDLRRVGYVSAQGPVVPSDGEFLPLENPATGRSIGEAFEVDAATLDEIIGEAVSTYRTTWRRVAPALPPPPALPGRTARLLPCFLPLPAEET